MNIFKPGDLIRNLEAIYFFDPGKHIEENEIFFVISFNIKENPWSTGDFRLIGTLLYEGTIIRMSYMLDSEKSAKKYLDKKLQLVS